MCYSCSSFDTCAFTHAMEADVASLQRELDDCLARIRRQTFEHFSPSPASISTMTMSASLNVRRVCRDSMLIALSLVEGDGPLTSSTKRPAKRQRQTVFFNQVTLRHGSKSVKVFDNGSMHVTGCTSPLEFLEVSSAVCTLMSDVAGIETTDGSDVRVTAFNVHMINLNFGAGVQLYLQGLRDMCAASGFQASYDADTYPGLNVKLPIGDRRITVLIFKSGKIIITGAKTPTELESAYNGITAILGDVLGGEKRQK